MTSDIETILARVETATGPDVSIDEDLALWAGWTRHKTGAKPFWKPPGMDEIYPFARRYTGSVDAAISLADSLAPGEALYLINECAEDLVRFTGNRVDLLPLKICGRILRVRIAEARDA